MTETRKVNMNSEVGWLEASTLIQLGWSIKEESRDSEDGYVLFEFTNGINNGGHKMTTRTRVAILPESHVKDAPWAVYNTGVLLARFSTLINAKAYKTFLERK